MSEATELRAERDAAARAGDIGRWLSARERLARHHATTRPTYGFASEGARLQLLLDERGVPDRDAERGWLDLAQRVELALDGRAD
jgi:hypothetical protein